MIQIVYQAADTGGVLDASSLAAGNTAVLRGAGGDDTLIGSVGNDRLTGGAGNNVMVGGAGDDQFFTALSPVESDTIDGGSGADALYIAMTAAQLARADVFAALVALNTFETYISVGNPNAHFVNSTLRLDLTGVETVRVRVDGVVKTLDSVGAFAVPAAPAPATHLVDFEDATLANSVAAAVPDGYAGYHWSSFSGMFFLSTSVYHMAFGNKGAPPASTTGDIAVASDNSLVSGSVLTKIGGGEFGFGGARLASFTIFGGTATDVTFTGTNHGTVVGSSTIHVDNAHWTDLQVTWGAIDALTVTTSTSGTVGAAFDSLWLS